MWSLPQASYMEMGVGYNFFI
uniref:Uncharacterized protein n=1 Tax=Arundo donax TaxID=35708 RepID=A0A0A8Z044_ARUDO